MTAGSAAVFAPPHFLIFTRENRVLAQWIDLKSLELKGEPAALDDAPSHSSVDGEPVASASANGRLAILQSRATDARLQWLDRSGQPRGFVSLPTAPWSVLRLSPDGQRVGVSNGPNLWVVDLARGFPTRIAPTSSGAGPPAGLICWAPDGNRIAYLGSQAGRDEIFVGTADGAPGAKLLPTTNSQFKDCYDWSADGQNLVIGTLGNATGWDMSLLPMDGFSRPETYLADPTNESLARISPDGKWMAYASNESGQREIFAQSFPLPGHKVRMTVGGVGRLMWARGGTELLFTRGDSLYSLPVEVGEDLKPGLLRPLFKLPPGQTGIEATADGERVLVSAPAEIPQREIKVMLDWIGLLKR